jgi:hypothetical protein
MSADSKALLEEFRKLGGTAENIEIRRGPRGRGLFAIDPAKPVYLNVPPNLLVPIGDVKLRGGHLVVAATTRLSRRECDFFESYQRDIAWSAGALDELWQAQLQWSRLPLQIQDTLRAVGWIVDLPSRFREPSEEVCLRRYIQTRAITYEGTNVLMPMMELLNHSDAAGGFEPGTGVSVSGTFQAEVLVNYGCDDCWGRALSHGFCDPTGYALSLAFSYHAADVRIAIHHDYHLQELSHGLRLPVVSIDGGAVHFSHLILGHTQYPQLPRAVFQSVARNTPLQNPDELFDIVQHYNRMQLLKVLRVTENAQVPLAAMLHDAAYQQLTALSSHWGTASLAR